MSSTAVIVLAGGVGSRMLADTPKQYLKLSGKPVLAHTLEAIRKALPTDRVLVVCPIEDFDRTRSITDRFSGVELVAGGGSRQESCFNALQRLEGHPPDHVLIHDASRPFVTEGIIAGVLAALSRYSAVDVAIPTADTIILERDGVISAVPDRSRVFRGQTPQGFQYSMLLNAYRRIGVEKLSKYTDDCGIFLDTYPGVPIKIVDGSPDNLKITYPIDAVIAEELFRLKSVDSSGNHAPIDVENRCALVFGGTRGIGKAIVDVLNDAGCETIAVSRSTGCDVGQLDDVRAAYQYAKAKFGRIDFVVNSAGLLFRRSLVEQTPEEVEQTVRTNLVGAINISKAGFDDLQATRGMLLHLASSSYTRGRAEYAPYSATKAAVVNLTQGLAEEWSASGVRVNCLIPGRTKTPMRIENFGHEKPADLANSYSVALDACRVLSSAHTGLISRCFN